MLDKQREALADISHDIWVHWMRWQFSVCIENEDGSLTIPAAKVERWQRQINTPYSELSEKEKDSDREQADKIQSVLISPSGQGVSTMSVPSVLKSRRFVSGVVGLIVIILAGVVPELRAEFETIATAVVVIVGVLIGGYSAEDFALARNTPVEKKEVK